jgi:ATP-binding cassette subfamily D (ALD) long-chain fatty acid import protein
MGESGEEWDLQRIGTESEKSSVEKELCELRERLAKVEEWKQRRQEIEDELNKVWVEGGETLPPPPYAENTPDQDQGISPKPTPNDENAPSIETENIDNIEIVEE